MCAKYNYQYSRFYCSIVYISRSESEKVLTASLLNSTYNHFAFTFICILFIAITYKDLLT